MFEFQVLVSVYNDNYEEMTVIKEIEVTFFLRNKIFIMNIFLPLLIFDFLCIFGNGEPLITIDQGILEGTFEVARYGREYAAFLGIPYAKPPVGDFR